MARPGSVDGLSRRGFMGVATGAALAGSGLEKWLPSGPVTSNAFAEPARIHSRRGRLDVELVIEERECFWAGARRAAVTYNGGVPGPTLVADPGDRLHVRLVNRLSRATNLHTHGFHVSPGGNADNVMIDVPAGETFDYEYEIPRDHPPGLNWYHSHPHGDGTLKPWSANLLATQVRLVNGRQNPIVALQAGATERWRVVNASVSDFFDLQLDGHQLVQIAADGNPFAQALTTDVVRIPPGGRAEVLMRADAPGRYALRALPTDHGAGFVSPELVLATVDVHGNGRRRPVFRPEPLLQPFCDLRTLPLDGKRTITMSMTGGFKIDGKLFDHDRVDQVVQLGAVEEWTIVNDSVLPHPFHIHINPFQVTHVDGAAVDALGYRDTITVPPRQSVTFRTVFADFTGRSFFHCHITPHSDLGMMAVFEIVAPGGRPRPKPPGFLCRL